METEKPFANPQPPASHNKAASQAMMSHSLTNADFRKLLMTPSAPHPESRNAADKGSETEPSTDKKKQKKLRYSKSVREDKNKAKVSLKKYRDRAKERREHAKNDTAEIQQPSSSSYRAVAPDSSATMDAAARRRQIIEESKFLGGDIDHTHLVKGLDYALLQKIRTELACKETAENKDDYVGEDLLSKEIDEPLTFKTPLAQNICQVLFTKPQRKSERFVSNRLAYVVDLEDNYSDIPTTLLRSKLECQENESSSAVTSNDLVIQKLTEILYYLRNNKREVKRNKRSKKELDTEVSNNVHNSQPIYEPNELASTQNSHPDERSSCRNMLNQNSLFPAEEAGRSDAVDSVTLAKNVNEAISNLKNAYENKDFAGSRADKPKLRKKIDMNIADSYAECYPGTAAEEDVNIDSEDEPDYNKMDLGNKKGPVGRWDFDTPEEYSDYMSKREAMPKAAFQYGVKMVDGRKTRRLPGSMSDKRKLDREWQQITKIIEKRKAGGSGADRSIL